MLSNEVKSLDSNLTLSTKKFSVHSLQNKDSEQKFQAFE